MKHNIATVSFGLNILYHIKKCMNLNLTSSHSFFSAEVPSPEPMPHPVDLLVVEPQGLELPLVQPELLEGRLVHRIAHARVTSLNLLQTLIEKILQKHSF